MPSANEAIVAVVEQHVPCAHLYWPSDSTPPLPWAVYMDEPDSHGADNGNYADKHRWTVELYEKSPDPALERALLETLRGTYGYVEPPTTTWIESEGASQTVYRFSEIERN